MLFRDTTIERLAKQLCMFRLGMSQNMIKISEQFDEFDKNNLTEMSSDSELSDISSESESSSIDENEYKKPFKTRVSKLIDKCTYILAGNYNHCAAIFKQNKKRIFNVYSLGQNKYLSSDSSIHAEADAIEHLKLKSRKIKNLESVNLLVIRVTKTGLISNSAPCIHCLRKMAEEPLKKGYRIEKVYYSNEYNQLECYKLSELIHSDNLHISSYYKHTKYDINKWFKWRDSKF